MSNAKKIIIAVLLLLTVVLAGVSVYVAIRIQQEDQAPDDSAASTGSYLTKEFIIGGYPDQSLIDQYYACVLYDNPCASGTGEDSVCYCPGYDSGGTVGCLNGDHGGSAPLINPKGTRYGQS